MFTLAEIKEIEKKYTYWDDTQNLTLYLNLSAKRPENLSQEEKNKIISALFLGRIIEGSSSRTRSEQEVLDKVQSDFYQILLTPGKKSVYQLALLGGNEIDHIMLLLASPEKKSNYMPEVYMQYILNENGKKATNIHREVEYNEVEGYGGFYSIQYDIEDLDKRKAFQKSLDANHPQYVQPVQKVELSPEQRKNRRRFVEKNMQYYNMTLSNESYQHRVESEEQYMQQVVYIVNNHGQMTPVNSRTELFCLLNAAQNLTLDYGKDFLEELLSQPEVYKALLDFKSSGYHKLLKNEALADKKLIQMRKKNIENLKKELEYQKSQERTLDIDYRIKEINLELSKNEAFLSSSKKPLTAGEIDRKAANECLANSQEPDLLLTKAKTLRTFSSNATDATSLTRSEKGLISLIRVAMRQDGIQPGNIKIGNGAISIEEQENENTLTN